MLNKYTNHETFVTKLCSILAKQKVFSDKNARELATLFKKSQKENFDNFLLEDGFVSKEQLLDALSMYFQTPAFDVSGYFFNHELVIIFPKDELHRYACIPLWLEEDILTVVASEPNNPAVRDFINEYVDFGIELYVGIRLDITNAITEFYDRAVTEVDENGEATAEEKEELEEINILGRLPGEEEEGGD